MSRANQAQTNPRKPCVWDESLPPYVQGELSGEELERLTEHLTACPTCRQRVAELRELITRMKALPPESVNRDLAPAILARIPETAWGRGAAPTRRVRWLSRVGIGALAASVVAAALVALLYSVRSPERKQASTEGGATSAAPAEVRGEVVKALEWLAASQEEDGSWDPEKWGGQPQYEVGLSALAVLAFLGAGQTQQQGHFADSVERGLQHLMEQQDEDGLMGPAFSSALYNHGIATIALLEAYAITHDAALKDPITSALAFIRENQGEEGAWGYLSVGSRPNTSVTAWQLQSLLLAGSLDWPEAREAAEKGMAWLSNTVDKSGRAGYHRKGDFPYGPQNLSAMAAFCLFVGDSEKGDDEAEESMSRSLTWAMAQLPERVDYCRWYYLSHALHAAGVQKKGVASPQSAPLAELDRSLVANQLTEGPNSGSWDPSDQWSGAGGRVYSTAMAALALQADRRAKRLLAWVDEGSQ